MENKYDIYLKGHNDMYKSNYQDINKFDGFDKTIYKLGWHHAKLRNTFTKQEFELWLSKNLMN